MLEALQVHHFGHDVEEQLIEQGPITPAGGLDEERHVPILSLFKAVRSRAELVVEQVDSVTIRSNQVFWRSVVPVGG